MEHSITHDPLIEWQRCWACHQGLSAAFARLADLQLGPARMEQLIAQLRKLAGEAIARGAAS